MLLLLLILWTIFHRILFFIVRKFLKFQGNVKRTKEDFSKILKPFLPRETKAKFIYRIFLSSTTLRFSLTKFYRIIKIVNNNLIIILRILHQIHTRERLYCRNLRIRIANASNKRISLKKVLFLIKYFQRFYPNTNLKLMNFLWNTLHTEQPVALIWKTSGWLKPEKRIDGRITQSNGELRVRNFHMVGKFTWRGIRYIFINP